MVGQQGSEAALAARDAADSASTVSTATLAPCSALAPGNALPGATLLPAHTAAAPAAPAPADLARAVVDAVQGLFSGADATFAAQWQDGQRVVVLAELDRVCELVGPPRSWSG